MSSRLTACLQGKAGAQRVADNAVPATKRFNEEQLKPGADRAGEGLKTGADCASQGLQNAADQVSQQAGQCVGYYLYIVLCLCPSMEVCPAPCVVLVVDASRYVSSVRMVLGPKGVAVVCGMGGLLVRCTRH